MWAFMGVLFSSLPKTLIVTASPKPGDVLHAGEDTITVTWLLDRTAVPAGGDAAYEKVKVLLCYAPVSQKDRGWRKTDDLLKKDKTCQFTVVEQPYGGATAIANVTYTVKRDVPTATYFVRAYALDGSDTQVAYGQTTDAKKTANLFDIVAITGRHASLDIAAGCFSAFSIAALIFFFFIEKRKVKK
ncbi:High-affinity nitrate transporter-activating protein 2.1 [Ananas comosus]|uniref:High-affinity nitrate transporter-activating protein 2.1 n=1 Tax=Ananas comosus TaxID=4615 RepID=A0A199VNM0_ANACO|nr:High-affinity nitrate transporter-activating protein 2.1 [Ananas comosus]